MVVRVFIIFFVIFIACKISPSGNSKSRVFHYNQPNYITSLDPIYAKSQNNIWAVDHIFNQLVDLNDSLQLKPEIATWWEISHDRMKYVFHLRTDIFYHKHIAFGQDSTRKLNASDIVYSFTRLIDTTINAPGSWVFDGKIDSHRPFVAPDDSTFVLNLSKPFSPILQILTMQYCSIVPHEAVEYYKADFRKNPIGTGAFVFKKWHDRNGLFLRKNNLYFEKNTGNIDGIRISFIEDKSIAYLDFLKGNIDFFSGINSSFGNQIFTSDGQLKNNLASKFQFIKHVYLNSEYIGFNLSKIPSGHILHNITFRQALAMSIDRELLVNSLRYGLGTPAERGFIPKGLASFDSMSVFFKYNPDSAKAILTRLNYDYLNPNHQLKIFTNKDYLDIIVFVANQWQKIGIHVDVELMETSTLREQMKKGTLPVFRASWISDYPDEESFLNVFYSHNGAPPNYTRFNNEVFDKLYEDCIEESNMALRHNIYIKMNNIINQNLPLIPLFYDETAWFVSNKISGLQANSLNLLKLENISKN